MVPSLDSASASRVAHAQPKQPLKQESRSVLIIVDIWRLDRVRKQMTVSGNMSQEMDRHESRNNWKQVKNESYKYLDHNSKRESGNAET